MKRLILLVLLRDALSLHLHTDDDSATSKRSGDANAKVQAQAALLQSASRDILTAAWSNLHFRDVLRRVFNQTSDGAAQQSSQQFEQSVFADSKLHSSMNLWASNFASAFLTKMYNEFVAPSVDMWKGGDSIGINFSRAAGSAEYNLATSYRVFLSLDVASSISFCVAPGPDKSCQEFGAWKWCIKYPTGHGVGLLYAQKDYIGGKQHSLTEDTLQWALSSAAKDITMTVYWCSSGWDGGWSPYLYTGWDTIMASGQGQNLGGYLAYGVWIRDRPVQKPAVWVSGLMVFLDMFDDSFSFDPHKALEHWWRDIPAEEKQDVLVSRVSNMNADTENTVYTSGAKQHFEEFQQSIPFRGKYVKEIRNYDNEDTTDSIIPDPGQVFQMQRMNLFGKLQNELKRTLEQVFMGGREVVPLDYVQAAPSTDGSTWQETCDNFNAEAWAQWLKTCVGDTCTRSPNRPLTQPRVDVVTFGVPTDAQRSSWYFCINSEKAMALFEKVQDLAATAAQNEAQKERNTDRRAKGIRDWRVGWGESFWVCPKKASSLGNQSYSQAWMSVSSDWAPTYGNW